MRRKRSTSGFRSYPTFPTTVNTFVKPSFAARINGALYALEGQSKPFTTTRETELDIDIKDLNIPYYLAYVPVKFNAKLMTAALDVKAKLSYRQEKDGAPFVSLAGNVKLKNVALDDLKGKPIMRLPLLSVDMASVRPLDGEIHLARLALDAPELHIREGEKGEINLKTLLPAPQQAQKGDDSIKKDEPQKAEGKKTVFAIDEFLIEKGKVAFAGSGPRDPFSLGRSEMGLDVKASLSYRQEKEGEPSLSLAGNVKLKNVALDDLQGKPLLRLSLLNVDMAEVMPLAGQIHLAKIALDAPELHIRKDEKGEINLKTLLRAPQEAQKGDGSIKKEEPQKAEVKKTVVAIDEFLVEKGKIAFADAGPRDPFNVVLNDIRLQGSGISTAAGREGKASLSLSLPKKGRISLEGPITVEPLSAKLALVLKDLDIPAFQPYLSDVVNVKVTGGKVSADGKILVDSAGGQLKTRYSGKVLVSRFASIDGVQANDLIKWEALHFKGIDAGLNPLSVHIREIALSRFFARVLVNADGTLNLQNLMVAKQDAPVPSEPAAAEGKEKPAATPGETKAAADIKMDAVTLQGGEIDFTDRLIQPNFAGRFVELGGRISGLSSMETTRADVEIRGKLDGYAPLEITGKINPLAKDLFVDIKAAFKDMDLSPMTPYSGKYIGYTIQKGKLSFELKYLIDRKKLDSINNIFIDQFNLGEKVESPQATKLPVSLAIALLKDRNDQIKLDIPVSGTLDDPEFSIWRIILQVLVNLLTKAATAPFALLGALFGGGEEMSFVEFDYGSASLPEADLKKIQTLSKAMNERPALKLDVEGYVDAEKDREGLKDNQFRNKLKAQKLKEEIRQGKEAIPLEKVVIGADEYEKVPEDGLRRGAVPETQGCRRPGQKPAGSGDGKTDADPHRSEGRRSAPSGLAARPECPERTPRVRGGDPGPGLPHRDEIPAAAVQGKGQKQPCGLSSEIAVVYFFPKTATNGLLKGTFSLRGLIRWGRARSGRSCPCRGRIGRSAGVSGDDPSGDVRFCGGPPGAAFPEAPSPGVRFSPGFPPCAGCSAAVRPLPTVLRRFLPPVFSRRASAAAFVRGVSPVSSPSRLSLSWRFVPDFSPAVCFFSVSEIRFRSRSTARTVTSTVCRTFRTSPGFFTNRSAIWLRWTRPSWWTPMSTKAPKAVRFVTIPGSFIPGVKVLDLLDPLGEPEGLEPLAGVAAGPGQLGKDVVQGRKADLVRDVPGRIDPLPEGLVAHQVGDGAVQIARHPVDDRIAFGVDGGGVQGILPVADPEEAGGLHEGLHPEAGHLLERLARRERAVLVPPGDDLARQGRPEAGDVGEERGARRVQLDADGVHAAHDGVVQGLLEFRLVDVVLVLPHADRLRVDLDQLGQRVGQPPADGNRPADGDVLVRETPPGRSWRRNRPRRRFR